MVEFKNALGGRMWVADNRVDEYLAAGYKLAANVTEEKPVEIIAEIVEEIPKTTEEAPKKKATKTTKEKKVAKK